MLRCVAALVFTAVAPAQNESAFTAWAEANAHRVPPDPARAAEALEWLAERVRRSRVVFLGEADHYVRDVYAARLAMIRYLQKHGLIQIGIESGWFAARRAERFLATGDREYLDEPPPDERDAVAWEESRFLEDVRELIGSSVRWFGYDVDENADIGYRALTELLEPFASNDLVATTIDGLRGPPRETPTEETRRLAKLVASLDGRRDALLGVLGPTRETQLFADLDALIATVAFRGEASKAGAESRVDAFIRREQLMIRLVDRRLARLGQGQILLLIGHDLRLARSPELVQFGPKAGPRIRLWPTLGAHLANRLDRELTSIWSACGSGRHLPFRGSPARSFTAPEDTVEAELLDIGRSFVLPLDSSDRGSRYLDAMRPVLLNGTVVRVKLTEQADVLWFLRGVSAPRIYPSSIDSEPSEDSSRSTSKRRS